MYQIFIMVKCDLCPLRRQQHLLNITYFIQLQTSIEKITVIILFSIHYLSIQLSFRFGDEQHKWHGQYYCCIWVLLTYMLILLEIICCTSKLNQTQNLKTCMVPILRASTIYNIKTYSLFLRTLYLIGWMLIHVVHF